MCSEQGFSVEAMGIEPTNLLHAMQILDRPGRISPSVSVGEHAVLLSHKTLARQEVSRPAGSYFSEGCLSPCLCAGGRQWKLMATLLATSNAPCQGGTDG